MKKSEKEEHSVHNYPQKPFYDLVSTRGEFSKKSHLSYMQPAKIEDELEDSEHLFKIKAATAIEHNWAIEHLWGNELTGT